MIIKGKCRKCRFRAPYGDVNGCDYMHITGHMRGCPPGDDCTRFEEGERKRAPGFEIPPALPVPDEERDVEGYISNRKRRLKNEDSPWYVKGK